MIGQVPHLLIAELQVSLTSHEPTSNTGKKSARDFVFLSSGCHTGHSIETSRRLPERSFDWVLDSKMFDTK